MPDRLQFYFDEMISADIASGLRRRGVEVLTTHEAGNLSQSDEQQLAFAKEAGRVVFTMDNDFLILHNAGQEHAGIVYVAQNRKISVGDAVKSLMLIHEVLTREDLLGHVEFL